MNVTRVMNPKCTAPIGSTHMFLASNARQLLVVQRSVITPSSMKAIDLTGRRIGRLTVLRFLRSEAKPCGSVVRMYAVRCDCGTEKDLRSGDLLGGRVQSCGCLMREVVRHMRTKHGHAGKSSTAKRDESSEYRSWRAMKGRCHDPNNIGYANYGGRGITVCEEWRHNFAAFLAHIGPKPTPGHTVDRIDNDRGYEPGNVRWATWSEQMKNRRPRVSKCITSDSVSTVETFPPDAMAKARAWAREKKRRGSVQS